MMRAGAPRIQECGNSRAVGASNGQERIDMGTGEWAAIAGISVGTLVLSMGLAAWLLVRVPPDYFKGEKRQALKKRPLWMKILKNAGGVLLVLLGLVLSVPGVPGQGLLMVLCGLMLLDLPGKYKLERKILSLSPIRRAANKIRAWRGRPPLQFPRA
jgi:hypothetical protein